MIESRIGSSVLRVRDANGVAFELHLKPRALIALVVGILLVYVALAWSVWQSFVPSEWLRLGAAWLIFLAPGFLLQHVLWRDVSKSQRLIVGFGVAVTLGAVFGFIATALHVGLWFVVGALNVVTCVCALLLALRAKWQWHTRRQFQFSFASLLVIVPLVVAGLIVVRLTHGLAFDADDLTYNAYLTHWLEAPRFDWQQLPLAVEQIAPSRFWMAYWTLNEALLARWSALHGIELTRLYLAPFLALTALLATYAVARAFGMTRRTGSFAVAMQTAALLLLTNVDQAGLIFFNRLVEDKVVTAFILIPALVVVVTAFLKQHTRGRFVLMLLVGAALVLTHPTIMAVGAAVVGLCTVFSTLVTREWRGLGAVLLVLGLMLSVPLFIRLFDTNYVDKIPFAFETLQRDEQVRRVLEWQGPLYSLHPDIFWGLPFAWLVASALLALFELKTSDAARWILSASLIFISVINPFTTWLWGFAIGSSQIWRVVWFMPFGIAAVYCVSFVWRRVFGARWKNVSAFRLQAIGALASVGILLGALFFVWQNAKAEKLHALRTTPVPPQRDYSKLLALKTELDAQLTEPTVVMGATRWLNDRLPALSSNARVFVFRTDLNMWKLNNLEWDDADERVDAWFKLQAPNTRKSERLAILKKYKVQMIVADANTPWLRALAASASKRVQYIGTHNAFELYRVLP